ncbi:MAG: metallophosphoesterase, partial [Clostridiales bacterium]|nr:metallophosphoesterase [Clostridiales bacterium]
MDGQKTSYKTRLACFLLAFVLSLGAYAFIEPRMLLVREYTVGSARVPEAFDGLSIAFVADLHLGDYFPLSAVRDMVARVNALRPDLVLLGGDYVGYDAKYIAPAFEALSGLCAPMGVYGVLGNHDNWTDADLCRAEAARHGITLVDNRMLW